MASINYFAWGANKTWLLIIDSDHISVNIDD